MMISNENNDDSSFDEENDDREFFNNKEAEKESLESSRANADEKKTKGRPKIPE